MTDTNDTRAVSDEDREVLDDLARAICDAGPNAGLWDTDRLGDVTRREIVTSAGSALAVVVAHGWGPKPTVSRKEMERHIYHAARSVLYASALTSGQFDSIVSAAVGAVMVAGIEVADV